MPPIATHLGIKSPDRHSFELGWSPSVPLLRVAPVARLDTIMYHDKKRSVPELVIFRGRIATSMQHPTHHNADKETCCHSCTNSEIAGYG